MFITFTFFFPVFTIREAIDRDLQNTEVSLTAVIFVVVEFHQKVMKVGLMASIFHLF